MEIKLPKFNKPEELLDHLKEEVDLALGIEMIKDIKGMSEEDLKKVESITISDREGLSIFRIVTLNKMA